MKKFFQKWVVVILISLFCLFMATYVGHLMNSSSVRFLISGLVFFFIPFAYFKIDKINKKRNFYILLIPVFVILITSINSDIISKKVNIIPLGLINMIALFFAYRIQHLKSKKVFMFLFLMTFSSYIYATWLRGANDGRINKVFPELSILDEDGNKFLINEFNNKVIVIDLWSSACGICFREFPNFEKLQKKYKKDTQVEFFSLNLPIKRDTLINIPKLIDKYNFSKLYAKELDSWIKLDVKYIPKILIIDKKGNIRYKGNMNDNKFFLYNNINLLINKMKNEQ